MTLGYAPRMEPAVRVGHLSDTHFLEAGAPPEGGHAYDTAAAFDAVLEHLGDHDHLDLMVVTGDVADHGRPGQYELAAEAFARFAVPVNVCPGNHDLDRAFRAGIDGHAVGTSRVVELGAWTFLFVDSNAGQMVPDDAGDLVDPPGEVRLHANGSLGDREASWIREACERTDAEHVFVWVHHPPGVPVPLVADEAYTAEWLGVLQAAPAIRGIGGGHTHIPSFHEVVDRPVFVAPSLKNNFDLVAETWLPPGYRTYEFGADGTISSDLHLVDDDRWPRRPFGRAIRSLFNGELTHAELAEIVARRSRSQP